MKEDLEARLTVLEERIARYEEMFAAFAAGPGRKLAAMLGLTLPEVPR